MIYTARLNETIALRVIASQPDSEDQLWVEDGEEYTFSCHPEECWVDWYLPSTPDGITNALAWMAGLRVRGVKCFCLCAAYAKTFGGFAIGSRKTLPINKTGALYFFANDAPGAYGNNRGIITVNIKRTK